LRKLEYQIGVTSAATATVERWELYRLLAEPVRLKLLALAAEDELAVSELSQLLGESQPNISRHAAPLRQAGLLSDRRQGTWTLLRLAEGAAEDAVVADALRSGRALCLKDGILGRVAEIVRAREAGTREFFARKKGDAISGPPAELVAYLAALAALLPHRKLAVDAGAGDGPSLELLAPMFDKVIALDRSETQLSLARERIAARGFHNVQLVQGELGGVEVKRAIAAADSGSGGADVVLAARMLHHAPRPQTAVKQLTQLLAPGGALMIIDYARHNDESMRLNQADLWLGFEAKELLAFARTAGLDGARVIPLPGSLLGDGPDKHLPWHVLVAHVPQTTKPVRPVSRVRSKR
jgi:DNA-binding transcriptional ArsR family regulator